MKFEAVGPLDRATLRRIFDHEGVDSVSYNLDGSHGGEVYVLSHRAGGWTTFYSERGHEVERRRFDTEDAACSDLLERVLRDPTTRRRQ